MIGLDTNVLVRYLVQDDATQFKSAADAIDKAAKAGEKLYLNQIVLCELVWVLESCYHLDANKIGEVLERILSTREFEVEGPDLAWNSLYDFKRGSADFPDCLIGRKNASRGCDGTLTFDNALKKLAGFRLLKAAKD